MRVRSLLGIAFVGAAVAVMSAQRGQGGDNQPGRKWSEAELKRFANGVRAGRKLTPASWPNGARVAVCLTFSLNNTANRLARGDSAVVALTGGEFGATTGLPRVLDVLDRHNVPATFFVPATAAIVDPGMIPSIAKRPRHEIGVLGWSDENTLDLNNQAEEERLLTQAIAAITKASGKKPAGARGPSSVVSLHTLGLVKKAGLLYDSTLMAMDEPYEILLDGQPSGLVELPVSRLLDDYPTLTTASTGPSTLPSPELVFETFRNDFDAAYEERTLFLLTLHPHLIGMRSRIGYLDELLKYIKSKPGVWIATAEEIARLVKPR